jgi:zinc transport system permease protein
MDFVITPFFRDLAVLPFLQHALLAGLLASVACGIVGTYVVTRRFSYVAGAISHCMLGGMGAARYLERVHQISWATPFVGALSAALISAVIISIITLYTKERQDTVLGAVWTIGMAVGISFIVRTPGYNEDLMSYLFGNILMVSRGDLYLMAALDAVVLLLTFLFYKRFLVICFNEELARLRGLSVGFYHLVLLVLTALTVTLLVQVVGIVMAIALLTLPAATAGHLTKKLSLMMAVASLLTTAFIVGGVILSYEPELPAGATIIELAGVAYLLVLLADVTRQRLRW